MLRSFGAPFLGGGFGGVVLESKKDRPRPAAAGDLSRNHREAAVRATFKFVLAVGRGDHLVHLAVVLAGEQCAGRRVEIPYMDAPEFARLSIHDGLKVKIAPVHSDFECGLRRCP